MDAPVVAETHPWGYVLTWRSSDPRWQRRLQADGTANHYELYAKLDDARKVAMLHEVQGTVRRRETGGPQSVWAVSDGEALDRRAITTGDLAETFRGAIDSPNPFDPARLRAAVRNTILSSGWDVQDSGPIDPLPAMLD